MNNWQIYPLTVADQQYHIEKSEWFLNNIKTDDRPILYWSVADPTGLVLGLSQKYNILNPAVLATPTLPIYHRRAGGTAVLVGPHLLSLDVTYRRTTPYSLGHCRSYRWFGEAWVIALRQLGIQARSVPPAEAHAQRTLRKHQSRVRTSC